MGYKKSFNLVTIQLIIPLSTMTKAEYKATYGIDLDDIDIEKVTLLQEDGSKNKYFVDEIKTTENGIDIYAGGKILSIGSSVSVVDDAYSVSNSKPIYCHPIEIYKENVGVLSGFIFNNSSDPLDTWAKLKTAILSFASSGVRRLIVSGSWITSDNKQVIVSEIISSVNGNKFFIVGFDVDNTFHSLGNNEIDITNVTMTVVTDGVNKIN